MEPTAATGIEIERKFLVGRLPDELRLGGEERVQQGYLAFGDGGLEVRLRRLAGRCFLTIKKGGGLTRLEEEIEIANDRFERLWPLTEGCRVEKTRHRIRLPHDLVAEVDVYRASLAGLVTVDVEFSSEAIADRFVAPGWFGAEVTGDPRYRNQQLAREGLPS
jgi:adenylate cyclase